MTFSSRSWSTSIHLFLLPKEGSGKAGCRYEHVEGDLVFEKGVFERTIDIRILENALWSATLEFKVLLEEPMRCHLGNQEHSERTVSTVVLLRWRDGLQHSDIV